MSFTGILSISLGAILVENFILVQFLGICPFMGVSKDGYGHRHGSCSHIRHGPGLHVLLGVNEFLLVPLGWNTCRLWLTYL